MTKSNKELCARFEEFYTEYPTLGLAVDLSRMDFPDDYFALMEPRIQKAFVAMDALEKGAIANPEEKRMVGHYWLRNPALAPSPEIRSAIEENLTAIGQFADQVHRGVFHGANGPFKNLLLIGIGGSALGPQFVSHALGHPTTDRMTTHFFDNTDPDGMDRVVARIKCDLGRTLCLVISKSGRTQETQNGMSEAEAAYRNVGLNFGSHAVAITSRGGKLDTYARSNSWLKVFPMWDWIGGRTSVTSAVGLLPAALQGIDISRLIAGAMSCDQITRGINVKVNPAARLALGWFLVGNGIGDANMVVLPYKDRLELFSRYLQQLVMESIGKRTRSDHVETRQGMTVFGNKGSTDQHAYVQQLIDGRSDFFVTFIQVLRERDAEPFYVETDVTSGDYLSSFLLGVRSSLYQGGSQSIILTLRDVSPFTVGVLIALFERAVGLYASLIGVNAYDQPGVEGCKVAAKDVVALQQKVIHYLRCRRGHFQTLADLASAVGTQDRIDDLFVICRRLAANPLRGVEELPGECPFESQFRMV